MVSNTSPVFLPLQAKLQNLVQKVDALQLQEVYDTSTGNLERQIASLLSLEAKLDEARQKLAVQAARMKVLNVRSTINLLPPDILRMILLFCIDLPDPSHSEIYTIIMVCRKWRDLVVESPAFWPTVSIQQGRMVDLVLKRGQDEALRVWCVPDEEWGHHDKVMLFMKKAANHASRWEEVTYQGPASKPATEAMEMPTPRLTSLYFRVNKYGTHPDPETLRLGADGPALRYLELKNACLPWESQRLTSLECIEIVSLHSNVPAIAQLHTILASSAPKLRLLSLRNWRDTEGVLSADNATELPAICLGCLLSIDLQSLPKPLVVFLLTHLDMPQCRTVSVDTIPCSDFPLSAISTPLRLLEPSVSVLKSTIWKYSSGTKSISVAPPGNLTLDRLTWVKDRVDPPGAEVTFDLEGCEPSVLDAVVSCLSKSVCDEDITLVLEATTSIQRDASGNPIFPQPLPLRLLTGHLAMAKHLIFGKYYDAVSVLIHLQTPLPGSNGWPLPHLRSLDLRQVISAPVLAPIVLEFVQKRIHGTEDATLMGRPDRLEVIYAYDDLRRILEAAPLLKDNEIRVMAHTSSRP